MTVYEHNTLDICYIDLDSKFIGIVGVVVVMFSTMVVDVSATFPLHLGLITLDNVLLSNPFCNNFEITALLKYITELIIVSDTQYKYQLEL